MKPYINRVDNKKWLSKMRWQGLYGRHVDKAYCTGRVYYTLTGVHHVH